MLDSRLTKRVVCTLTILALGFVSVELRASGTAAKKEEARKLFEEGQLHYKLGRFDEALETYRKAYEVLPLPAFLFNIGQCYRQLKNHERSVFFY